MRYVPLNFLLIVILFFLGCVGTSERNKQLTLRQKEVVARKKLELRMPLATAQRLMQSMGFECDLKVNATLAYYANPDDISMTRIRDATYLDCYSSEKKGRALGYLHVKLLLADDKVSEVFYVWQFDGP